LQHVGSLPQLLLELVVVGATDLVVNVHQFGREQFRQSALFLFVELERHHFFVRFGFTIYNNGGKSKMKRPENEAPGGMLGAKRMADPSEAAHDRARRAAMHVAFFALVTWAILQSWLAPTPQRGWTVILFLVAGIPLAFAVRIFELRFKMSRAEWQKVLGELPRATKISLGVYIFCMILCGILWWRGILPLLLGAWLYDFVTYFRHRPERMRHLYAVVMALEDLRKFRFLWAYGAVGAAVAAWLRFF
jgi:hypothetical protein